MSSSVFADSINSVSSVSGLAARFTRDCGEARKIDAFGFLSALAERLSLPRKRGAVILVTADTPLLASRGEGKTTATLALVDALRARGVDAAAVLRQPSMGITAAGSKGGASGGGKSSLKQAQLADWGLFGEMARIETAQNLIVSRAEKALEEGELDEILLPRVSEIPSKALRHIVVATGIKRTAAASAGTGVAATTDTAASVGVAETCVLTPTCELTQILVLARSREDALGRVGRMIVGVKQGAAVLARDVVDPRRVLMALGDAFDPAILETLGGSPVYMHCGPFANVSLGIPSLSSIEAARALHDVVIVEAGYGADAGAEKYLDVAVRRYGAPMPSAAVVVARATTWLGDRNLRWRFPFNIGRLEKDGIPCVPLVNLWDGEDSRVPTLRAASRELGLREPIVGNLFRDGNEPLVPQLDGLLDLLNRDGETSALPARDGMPLLDRLALLIADSYGVPTERIVERESFRPSLERARALTADAGIDWDGLAINAIKSPATITDDDRLPQDQRTVTLKKATLHAGAGLLCVNLTTSLTTSMPKIV